MGRQPSNVNWVTLSLLLIAAAVGYGTYKFFPVYWQAWEVDQVLADGVARVGKIAELKSSYDQAQAKERLAQNLRAEVVALGVRDPDMALAVNFVGDRVDLTCDYRAIVIHPIGGRYTVVPLHRRAHGRFEPPRY